MQSHCWGREMPRPVNPVLGARYIPFLHWSLASYSQMCLAQPGLDEPMTVFSLLHFQI